MTAVKKDGTPDVYEALQQELVLHPYRTVAIAAGFGYLLGTRLGGPLVALLSSRMGLRLASSAISQVTAPGPDEPGEETT